MQGFEVVSINDEKCIGHVTGRSGDLLIVEHGHLRHRRNALPLTFVEVDEANERVTTTLSAHLIYDSPDVHAQDDVDADAVAEHYGLSGVGAQGYGDQDAGELEAGVESRFHPGSAVEERAEIRREDAGSEGANDNAGAPASDSPGLLGDRSA